MTLVQAIIMSTNTSWMDRICRGYVGLIQRIRKEAFGSMGPPLHATNHHYKAILSIPYQWRCITRLGVGTTGSRDTTAPTKYQIRRNWPRIPTHNRPGSEHPDRPRRKAANHRWGEAVPSSRRLSAPPTSHCYKKDPPLAGTEDTLQYLHYCPLLYLRVGSSVVGS
jgi:hypothetical protein